MSASTSFINNVVTKTASLEGISAKWVAINVNDGLPQEAFRAGTDLDGAPLYVCRAKFDNALVPGKYRPSTKIGWIPYSGRELPRKEIEVLIGDNYSWVSAEAGEVPSNAVVGGQSNKLENLYIGRGRGRFYGTITPGKVQPSHRCLYIPFGGREFKLHYYDVLVHN